MKRILITFALFQLFIFSFSASAQDELWITGTAVPGGVQKITNDGNGGFKFAGQLKAGEMRIQTTKKAGKDTRFLSPVLPDALIANKGLHYTETSNADAAAWQVPFDEDRYRFTIDLLNLRDHVLCPLHPEFYSGCVREGIVQTICILI